jgi:hypothetical protein
VCSRAVSEVAVREERAWRAERRWVRSRRVVSDWFWCAVGVEELVLGEDVKGSSSLSPASLRAEGELLSERGGGDSKCTEGDGVGLEGVGDLAGVFAATAA